MFAVVGGDPVPHPGPSLALTRAVSGGATTPHVRALARGEAHFLGTCKIMFARIYSPGNPHMHSDPASI